MTVPIRGIQNIQQIQSDTGGIPMGPEPSGSSFSDTLAKALTDVSGAQDNAREMIEALVRGDPNVQLQDVMAASEEASISLELLVEVRNKLTEAYRSLMNMQS